MDWRKKRELFSMLIIIKLVYGTYVKNKFNKVAGVGGTDAVKCVSDAAKDRNTLAAKIEASNTCTGLDWGWGAAPSYDSGATYYEKKHFIKVYNPPKIPSGTMLLPIRFDVGAYVDMNITFLEDDFSYSAINLLDTVDPVYVLDGGPLETLMISFALRPQADFADIWSKRDTWSQHKIISPYPFPAGATHVITYKALASELQILIDGVVLVLDTPLTNRVPAQDTRQVWFGCCQMQLNAIEFVGV